MPLNLTIIEQFLREYQDFLGDKTLLRQERYRILSELDDRLQTALKDYTAFEHELASLIMHRVETTWSFEELFECHARAIAGVQNFYLEEDTVVDVHDLFRIIRDSITVRVLALVEKEMIDEGFGPPPTPYAWAGLGSEGRDEQTLMTDQDNMIVFEGDEPANEAYFKILAGKASERLDSVGFEKCKGNVMPTNPKWRGSLDTWKKRINERLMSARGEFELLDVIILSDARPIFGTEKLVEDLLFHFFTSLRENKSIMKDFTEAAVLMPTALTLFGKFKTEKTGEQAGKLNIKLLGLAPLVLSVRMATLATGIFERNTLKRIKGLGDAGLIKKDMEKDLTEAYLIFVKYRLLNQIRAREDGGIDKNFVDPLTLGDDGEERLRKAMRTVESFQKFLQELLLFGQPV